MKNSKMMMVISMVLFVIRVATLKWGKRKEECIIKSSFQIAETIGAANVFECLIKCEMATDCESISWYRDNTTCLLFDVNVFEDTRQKYNKWIVLDNWTTYARVIYPVVRRLNPDGVHAGMSFDVAVQTCLDKYSTIATPGDLLVNRQLGMDNCYCGWLSNGLNGLVAQTPASCPEHGYSTNVIYCNLSNTVAWCKVR